MAARKWSHALPAIRREKVRAMKLSARNNEVFA
jgi:hypothetical protein